MCNGGTGCLILNCTTGWEDYDGDVNNGCELDLTPAPPMVKGPTSPSPASDQGIWYWWIILIVCMVLLITGILIGSYLRYRYLKRKREEAKAKAAEVAEKLAAQSVNQ